MKKYLLIIILLICFIPKNIYAKELISNSRSGLLMDIDTGKILYEKNINDEYAVASMTKMMSQIIILENIENGNLKWDKLVKVSKNAADFGGSQIYLQPGEEMSVKDIFKGISMASANDGTVALAEEIAGTEEKFVEMMNKKARELGLKHTVFKNSTGLDEDGHYSSSYDMALIARELILKHPTILDFSSVYEDYLRQNTSNKFWLVNTNKLVRFYEGADGLKTGHTDNAKYCMAVTAKRKDMRLLAIVLGEETANIRNQETMELLDYGFNNYKVNVLKEKNKIIKTIDLDKANEEKINIILKSDLKDLLEKNSSDKKYEYKIKINDINLPVKKGDEVGSIEVYENNKKINTGILTVEKDLKKLNIFKLYLRYLKNAINGFNIL